nr:polyprenol phosphomannose-dependent alpha 1,6 mannosyltransferase MptB [Streptomyces coryli]
MLGLAGSALLTAGGVQAGALPVRSPLTEGRAEVGIAVCYFGLVLLVGGWLLLGRLVRGDAPPGIRDLLVTLALWALPLLLGPPLCSRDVYSYLAQGTMTGAGLDAYTDGPARLGGVLAVQVPGVWQHTPAPYGPLFLACAAVVADLARDGVAAGVLGMRLLALAGVGLMVAALPALARHSGSDPAGAVWLGALNPLLLVHLVAGAHNDALMLGLLGVGLVVAYRRPLPGAVLVTLAALVKAPAALGLCAVAVLWARRLDGRGRGARATAAVAVTAAGVTALASAATGIGFGWIAALRTPVSPHNWAPTQLLGRATGALLEQGGSAHAHLASPVWQLAGLAAAAALTPLLWRRHARGSPVYPLGLGLAAFAALGPAFRPWYALWGLYPLAAAAPHATPRRVAPAASAALALVALPDGFAAGPLRLAVATAGGAAAAVVLWCCAGRPPVRVGARAARKDVA